MTEGLKDALIAFTIAPVLFGLIVVLVELDVRKKFPIYGRNDNKLSNFTLGDFLLFIPLIPWFLIYICFRSSRNPFKWRPFAKLKFKVGDSATVKVNQFQGPTISRTGIVTEVRLQDGKEEIRIPSVTGMFGYEWHDAKDAVKLTPLEEAMK